MSLLIYNYLILENIKLFIISKKKLNYSFFSNLFRNRVLEVFYTLNLNV
jgi:hypothetical protein